MKILKNKLSFNYKKFIIIFTLIPCIAILTFSYFIICNMQVKKAYQDAITSSEKISTNLNLLFNHAQLSASSIASAGTITEIFSSDYGENIKAKIEVHNLLSVYFANYKNVNAEHEEILIYHDNPSIYDSRFTKQIFDSEPAVREIFESIENGESQWIYNSEEEKLFLYVKSADYGDTPHILIQYSIFLTEINESVNSIVLKDSPYKFVFSTSVDKIKNHTTIETELINKSYILCHIPNKLISGIYKSTGMYFLLVIALITATILMFASIFSNSITRRLTTFLHSLENNPNADTMLSYQNTDELHPIYCKIITLLKENKEMQQRTNRLNSMKTTLELELIQMKINPHLLYNTLAAFRWETIDTDPKFATAVEALAGYYRKVLHNGEYIIPFRDELELISDYISILSFTHQREYKLITDIPDEILDMYTIKLILQPFIENSILHGLANTEVPTIKIRAYITDNESIKIEITDNGSGIPKSDLDAINQDNYSTSIYKSYGIRNTKRRINLYYGLNSNIILESIQDEGTTVHISLENINHDKLMEKFKFLKS